MRALSLGICWLLCSVPVFAQTPAWQDVVAEARGQQVYFYAWAGSDEVNDYIAWAAAELEQQYEVQLTHVKVADIAEALQRLDQEGERPSAVDLLWVNGENFHYLKQQQQLLGQLEQRIPNAKLLPENGPWQRDFGVPTDGLELPWGVGQFTLLVRSAAVEPLRNAQAPQQLQPTQLLQLAQRHPGLISYPKPPEFHGTTFLKSLLWQLNAADQRLAEAPTPTSEAELLPPLWNYLEQLHPLLWRQGEDFVAQQSQMLQMLANRQLHLAVSFNPQQLRQLVNAGRMPPGIEQMSLGAGAITNYHYLAIAKRSQHQAAAQVALNFFLSEAAQQRKQNSSWGDSSVLTDLTEQPLFPAIPELHPGWTAVLEQQWLARYLSR